MVKKKKNKYKKLFFKLSSKQVIRIDKHCNRNNTTRNKLIKNAIKEYLQKYPVIETENVVSENQLRLFDDTKNRQLSILD